MAGPTIAKGRIGRKPVGGGEGGWYTSRERVTLANRQDGRRSGAALPSRRGGLMVYGVAWLVSGCAGQASDRSDAGVVPSAVEAPSSSEGVALLPSPMAETVYDPNRLHEIGQSLREPAARCFLDRALETAAVTEAGVTGLPEGQVKIRMQLAPEGRVLHTEVLHNRFADPTVLACFRRLLDYPRWPEHEQLQAHYIDAVYWVQVDARPELDPIEVRKARARAAREGKACMATLPEGTYAVTGLNLIGREGTTLANRIEASTLPEASRDCLTRAFASLRLVAAPESFVRPVAFTTAFEVEGGAATFEDEGWLRLVELEASARRAERKAALGGGEGQGVSPPPAVLGGRRVDPTPSRDAEAGESPATASEPAASPPEAPASASDVGIELGGGGGSG